MDPPRPNSPRPRKRRAIHACVSCRASKVRCDGNRPCQRCDKNNALCQYHEEVKDENILRIEKLEAEMAALRHEVDRIEDRNRRTPSSTLTTLTPSSLDERNSASSAVDAGLITWDQAAHWFHSFFSGSQYLVPIFSETHDSLDSVLTRSAILFDAIVSIGCRAEEGFTSPTYRLLQTRVRDHITNSLIHTSTPAVETVQAITLAAAYSDNGFVSIALALRFAIQLGLPHTFDQLIANVHMRSGALATDEQELYRLCRIWHGICNLELFFSLDGGKLPGLTLSISPRKIRSLLNHTERTAVDLRLLSQIELNMIRTDAYTKIMGPAGNISLPKSDDQLRNIVEETTVELSLWLQEWTRIIMAEPSQHQTTTALQNLHIQHEWAIMTLYLKAVASSGIENIAFMTNFQRDFVCRAKEAATHHLHHMLQSSSPNSSPTSLVLTSRSHGSTYLSTFRWTLDYVWAKCAVSVLLVLKLAILLRDPVSSVMILLRDAHSVLEELKRVTVGHIAYFQILQTSIEKCEAALQEYVTQISRSSQEIVSDTNRTAENEFQGYVPSEFVFEWDFPGLNLKHMPFGWQDLFVNIDGLF